MVDEFFISLAIKKAWEYQFLTYPNPAVGAVVVKDGKILSILAHHGAGKPHAEVEALKEAYYKLTNDKTILKLKSSNKIHEFLYKNHNNIFNTSTIYVTLEPCNHYGKTPPCSLLVEKLKLKKVVIATLDLNSEASGGVDRLKKANINVKVGVLEKEAKELLYPFTKWQKDKFIFFKMAQSLNGEITGGYISCDESLDFVHELRDKIDLIIIGGNSVRVDRPTLDTRRLKNSTKNPDILIYSRDKNFDKSIPLFNIPNRKVFIEDNLNEINNYKFIMIEGGYEMLKATKNIIDWHLIFIAPKIFSNTNLNKPIPLIELNYLHTIKSGVDLKIFAKIK